MEIRQGSREVRALTEVDRDALSAVREPAFGPPGLAADNPVVHPAIERWGLFVDDALVAAAARRPFHSWISGQQVPTCGIAGVAVAPEWRGQGLLTPLIEHILERARESGDALATLFASSPGIYRRFGFATVGSLDTLAIPGADLRGLRRRHELRRATAADIPEMRRIHAHWASSRIGALTRTGPGFPDLEWLSGTGTTLALDDSGEPVAYATWTRSPGDGAGASVWVEDMVWAEPAQAESLLWMLGTFSSTAPTVRVDTSGTGLLDALPGHVVERRRPYDAVTLAPDRVSVPPGEWEPRDYF